MPSAEPAVSLSGGPGPRGGPGQPGGLAPALRKAPAMPLCEARLTQRGGTIKAGIATCKTPRVRIRRPMAQESLVAVREGGQGEGRCQVGSGEARRYVPPLQGDIELAIGLALVRVQPPVPL